LGSTNQRSPTQDRYGRTACSRPAGLFGGDVDEVAELVAQLHQHAMRAADQAAAAALVGTFGPRSRRRWLPRPRNCASLAIGKPALRRLSIVAGPWSAVRLDR
jgi:hypothetical protein